MPCLRLFPHKNNGEVGVEINIVTHLKSAYESFIRSTIATELALFTIAHSEFHFIQYYSLECIQL